MYSLALLLVLLVGVAFVARRRDVFVRLPARFESVRGLIETVEELTRGARLGEDIVFHCRLALDEACANIITHSYANAPSGMIEAHVKIVHGRVRIRLVDYGEPYDPSLVQQPLRASSLDMLNPGGLGLFLIRSVMDEVHYHASPKGNSLLLVKYCQQP
jgi:serine/threonine-protein kinase RsbW